MVQSCAPPQTRSYTLSKMRGSLRRNHAKLKACLFAKHALNLTHTHSFFFFLVCFCLVSTQTLNRSPVKRSLNAARANANSPICTETIEASPNQLLQSHTQVFKMSLRAQWTRLCAKAHEANLRVGWTRVLLTKSAVDASF